MTAATNAAQSGAGTPTLTTWPFAKAFSWETNSAASLLVTNANVTAIHAGVAGTNVFYGSNNNIPADLISNQIFNLYRGPITLTGRFLNFTTSTQFNESYLSIIPSTYTNAVPVGQAGAAAVNSRIGISVGGTVNGANLVIYDNLSNATASTTIASAARPAAMTTNSWYTLAATFDIKDGNVVITNVSVNGTTVGFTYPVIIASSFYSSQGTFQTHTWVNSLRAVASVDDLLDDFTITTNPCYSISGTVFDDANGLTDATVNGTGINNPAGSQLYTVLVDENENIVNSIAVAAGGTYSFSNVPGGIFEVRLTNKVPGAAGADAPPASLPAGWINTGENIGAGAGNDVSTNGTILVGTGGSADVNFGIQAYTASAYTFDCTTNAITFDMIPENAQISHSTDQTKVGINNATVWSGVTNKFAWEAFGTDANLYGTASAIPQHANLTGANNPTNVFYGGVWQNINQFNTGQVSADFISKNTFSLSSTSGPITLAGRFLNKSDFTEDNESYVFIVPDNYTHFQPVVRYDAPGLVGGPGVQLQREGVYVGGNITTGLFIVNNQNVATVQTVPGSIAAGWGGLAPAPDAWWTLSATFDVKKIIGVDHVVVTNVSVNGSTAAYTYPVDIGTVAANSWVSSLRVGASADDLMDDFTIGFNPCIFGTVFWDVNGLTDGIVNGTPTGNPGGVQPLYIVVVSGGLVVASVPVTTSGVDKGKYTISNLPPGSYTLRVTSSAGTVGSLPPAVITGSTGEHIGNGAGSDGMVNGMISVSPAAPGRNTGATTVQEVNFGLLYPVLPASINNIQAVLKNKGAAISWEAMNEDKVSSYEIERSRDGVNWQLLSTVKPKANGQAKNSYELRDEILFTPTIYYRIKQVDVYGAFLFTDIVMLSVTGTAINNELKISPNPVANYSTATVQLFAAEQYGNCHLELVDVTGRLVLNQQWRLVKGYNQFILHSAGKLSPGIYNLLLKDAAGNIISKAKLIK